MFLYTLKKLNIISNLEVGLLKMDQIIRNGQVLINEQTMKRDIGIKNGKIASIVKSGHLPSNGVKTITLAEENYILPGLIDVHVHLNEPGRTDWEGLFTGTRALAAGGVSTFFDMPLNSYPPTTNAELVREKKLLASEKSVIHGEWWGALTPGNIDQLENLSEEGVIGYKAFMLPGGTEDFHHADDATLLKGMEKIAELGKVLAIHAESEAIVNYLTAKAIAEGRLGIRDYCLSRPVISELEAVERVLLFSEVTGCKIHICHISSPKVVEKVITARVKGIDVTMETCPHYLFFTMEDFQRLGPIAKCAPPLRTQYEVDGLWEALIGNQIDIVSSDHSPAPLALREKGSSTFDHWGGIAGAQNTLPVLLTEGHAKRGVSLDQIGKWTSGNPARRFGLSPQKGRIEVGADADLTIIDPNSEWTLNSEDLYQRHKENPYINETFKGSVEYTFSKGNLAYEHSKVQ